MNRLTTEQFIEKAKRIHGEKYIYSKVNYINSKTKVCIICPEHGEFWQTPHLHLLGQGCSKCGRITAHKKQIFSQEQVLKMFYDIHHDKYDYSKVVYKGMLHKILIVCPIHGDFYQTPSKHISGQGCPLCRGDKISKTKRKKLSVFVNEANKIHNSKYSYYNVKYINANSKIEIYCPIHGIFKQTPNSHLSGCGCPKCNSSHMENEIRNYLISHSISFEEQKQFDWLSLQKLDFYLNDYNVAIECQGIQHFKECEPFGGKNGFIKTQKRDRIKLERCIEYGVKIFYYANYEFDFPPNQTIYKDKEKLLKDIQNEVK